MICVRPTEKVSRTSATSGKNESRALIILNISYLLIYIYKLYKYSYILIYI